LSRKDCLDRQLEELRQTQRELQARLVIAALQVAHGLVVHPDGGREFLTGQTTFSAQDRDTIVYHAGQGSSRALSLGGGGILHYCTYTTERQAFPTNWYVGMTSR